MNYTVNQLAKLAGVSVRTLHHYDHIGLLKPAIIGKNKYRHYHKRELLRLQQILFFKELEFPLLEIKQILDNPNFNLQTVLNDQKKLLSLKRNRIDRLIKNINKTIKNMNDDQNITPKELYDPFKDDDIKAYQAEAKQRWGNTAAYQQSMAKVKKMSKEEMKKLKEDGKKFTRELADNMDKGINHPEVQKLISKHHDGIKFFYDCSIEMYRNLGQMYVDDARFTKYYDDFRPGLAIFMRDAIAYYCDIQKEAA